MEVLQQIAEALERGQVEQTDQLTATAVEQGLEPKTILDQGLIAGMNVVGERFRLHEIFLPDVLLAAKAMITALKRVKPLLAGEGVPVLGSVVIGSVRGDQHDIGKNLVGIMLKGAGLEVIDLGSDVSPQSFVDAAEQQQAGVIGMSALLTTTMSVMKDVVELLQQRGLKDRVKVIVGGAPVNEDFAREIGADAYGFDAANAVQRVKKLLAEA